MVFKSILSLQAFKLDMTNITFFRRSIKHTANAIFVDFWLVLPSRERRNFVRFKCCIVFTNFQNTNYSL